jgi:hypothetical protein
MSHPAFPVTMSSDSLRRRLAQQKESKSSEQPQNRQITASGENEKGQTSQPNSSRQPEQATPSRLPLSRLLQKQSQLSDFSPLVQAYPIPTSRVPEQNRSPQLDSVFRLQLGLWMTRILALCAHLPPDGTKDQSTKTSVVSLRMPCRAIERDILMGDLWEDRRPAVPLTA